MQILNKLELSPIEGGFTWSVDAPFDVLDDGLGKIEVPEGFISDLGSIPRLFWNIIPPEGPATMAYLIHDWLYARQYFTRQESDECLLRLLEFLGIGWTRYLIYWNLRIFGWVAWSEDGAKSIG